MQAPLQPSHWPERAHLLLQIAVEQVKVANGRSYVAVTMDPLHGVEVATVYRRAWGDG
jgi:hypothetical protein